MTAEYRKIRGNRIEPKSVHTDDTDSIGYTAGYAITSSQPHQVQVVPGATSNERAYSNIAPSSQRIQVGGADIAVYPTVFTAGPRILKTTVNGTREIVAKADETNIGVLRQATLDRTDQWLVIAGNDSQSADAIHYGSPSDIDSDTQNASISGVANPLPSALVDFYDDGGDGTGFVFAEYVTDGSDPRIIRFNGGSFTTVLTASNTRHFHSLDKDPFTGVMYATTGDATSESKFFKSTDYGKNWSEVTQGTEYRTLGLNFTADYIYWATDTDGSNLYRADRNDLSNPELVSDFSEVISKHKADNLYSYGTCQLTHPDGILIGLQDEDSHNYNTIPVLFYDFTHDAVRKVYDLPADYSLGNPGIQAIMPWQDWSTGAIYLQLQAVENIGDVAKYGCAFEISRLQTL